MASKLNNKAVLAYAEAFAKALCSNHFGEKTTIKGAELSNFSQIKQVNLFIIKILFEKWQGENAKIKSPFFDYSHPEVRTLLDKLMNTLSRHISIEQEDFEQLVTASVSDTIQLLLAPYVFYEQELQKLGENIKVTEELKPALKYVRTHKILYDKIMEELEAQSDQGIIQRQRAIEVVGDVIDNNIEYDDPKSILKQFSEVTPLKIQEFVTFTDQDEEEEATPAPEPVQQPEVKEEKQEQQSFFDTSFEEDSSTPSQPTPISQPVSQPVSTTTTPERESPEPKEEKPLFTSYKPNDIVYKKPEYTSPTSRNNNGVHTSSSPVSSVSQPITREESPIENDDVRPSFSERFKPSGKMMSELISLNQKFLFTKKLFGNNQDELEEAIAHIDKCSTQKEAIMYLKDNFLMKYDWDFQSEEVKELWELLELRF